MINFFLRTATAEKEYFVTPGSNIDLIESEKIWSSSYDDTLCFALVSHNGEVTFSVGPLESGRRDKDGRPIKNTFVVKSSTSAEKREMGLLFCALLTDKKNRQEFAINLEKLVTTPILQGGTWDGQLSKIKGGQLFPTSSSISMLPSITQRSYPAKSLEPFEWIPKILALLDKECDFAVGYSMREGSEVARKLQKVYNFDWNNAYIAFFSQKAVTQEVINNPFPQEKKLRKRLPWMILVVVGLTVLLITVHSCNSKKHNHGKMHTVQIVTEKDYPL